MAISAQCLKEASKKNEVILPAYSCPSLVAAILKAGLKPVLCDLKPYSFQLDLDQLVQKINPDTAAVMAVHLFGMHENVKAIKAIAIQHGIYVIEDAAQGNLGPVKNGAGRGDLIVLSFGRGKPMSLLSGGAVIVTNDRLNQYVRQHMQKVLSPNPVQFKTEYLVKLILYSIFFRPRMYWIPNSLPWLHIGETIFALDVKVEKIGPGVIALGNMLIQRMDKLNHVKIKLAKLYLNSLEDLRDAFEFIPNLDHKKALLRFPIIFKEKKIRDGVLKDLKQRGLGATGSYPVPLNELEGASRYFDDNVVYKNAKIISERILTLPLHEFVQSSDVIAIAKVIKKWL